MYFNRAGINMSKYKTVYTEVEVEVDISEFDTQDLLDELEDRGELPAESSVDSQELLEKIWIKRRQGSVDYQWELDQLIYQVLGHVV
jgi:hypothetical protein